MQKQTTEKLETLFNKYRERYIKNNPGACESDVEYRFISAIDYLMAFDPDKSYEVRFNKNGMFYSSECK